MALPGKDSVDIPLRVTKEGKVAIEAEAGALGVEQVELVRVALKEYFSNRGKTIQFSPQSKGGPQIRRIEWDAVEQVLERVKALGLPEPETEYKLGHKSYDMAWPSHKVAIEVAKRKRPADSNGWTVEHISPNMPTAKIDKMLKNLGLST